MADGISKDGGGRGCGVRDGVDNLRDGVKVFLEPRRHTRSCRPARKTLVLHSSFLKRARLARGRRAAMLAIVGQMLSEDLQLSQRSMAKMRQEAC